MGMDVVALAYGRDDAADVLAVLDYGIAHRQIFQGDLVSEGHILIEDAAKLAVILGDDGRTGRCRQ